MTFFWAKFSVECETRLFILILFAGALGSMVYVLRSFSWYVGQKELEWNWVVKYLLRPFVGAGLAVVFYLVIRGGFASSVSISSTFAYVALAALIGLFSSEAAEKLKAIAETIFQAAPKGKGSSPTASGMNPKLGPKAGGTQVTISGTGFTTGATVTFGTVLATSQPPALDGKSITATTPPSETGGLVKVTVKNADGSVAEVPGGFTYQ